MLPPTTIIERFDRFTASSLGASGDPGVAAVIVDAKRIRYCRGFGVDWESNPVTCDTPFALASLTKSVTAVAIMQLVEQHRVRLDAPVVRYLPWFASSAASRQITVGDLLYQLSGFDTATGLRWMAVAGPNMDELNERRVRALRRAPLRELPGTTFEYSNANYDLLGAIVARLSGMSYERVVIRRVLEPLGIHGARFSCDAEIRGYVRWFSIPAKGPAFPELCADAPAGGLIMSARQYGTYLSAHLDAGKTWSRVVLSPASWEALHHSPDRQPYAMGWFETIRPGGLRELHHNGWAPEFHAFVAFYPSLNIGAARLADANEVPDGGRSFPSELGTERILRGLDAPRFPLIPPDLYLRVGLLVLIAFAFTQLRFRPIRRRDALIRAAFNIVAVGGILAYVAPQWGYSPFVGYLFSPDLTILLLVLLMLLGASAAVSLVGLLRSRGSSSGPDVP